MADEETKYFASEKWRKATLASAIVFLCIGLYFLIRGILNAMVLWVLPLFIANFLLAIMAVYYYWKAIYVPVAVTGLDWVVLKLAARNKRSFTAKSRIKEIKILKKDIEFVKDKIFSLMICTTKGYRYFLYGLSANDRESLSKKLGFR